MPSLSKSFKFTVYTGVGTTESSVECAYPLYPIGTSGPKGFVSLKDQGAGYYATSNGLHVLTMVSTKTFVGTATIQATLVTDPAEGDWFDIDSAEFSYSTSSPDYIAPNNTGANPYIADIPRVDYVNFTGQFTWLRANVIIESGAILKISYNY
jgi:hypothetical protein